MIRFIAGTYHAELKVAEFITDDGRHLLRVGGTLPWRIHNCGDLSSPVNSHGDPNPKLTRDYIGFAPVPSKAGTRTYHFFIFPDYETGRRELEASLSRKYSDKCIPDLVKKYAPADDNDSDAYAERLLKATGISLDQKIGDVDPEQFRQLADAIEKLEGYHNEAESRREIWVPVSTIMATDGARPLADAEIVLRVNGKDTALKSNAVGQFPPIPHPREPVQVLQRTPNGKMKEIASIGGDKGQSYSLLTQLQRLIGMAGPDKPPSDASKQRQPFTYQVQPGDTMVGIAKRFRISVEEIKADNRRYNDKIFAGELLGIYGPPPQGDKPAKALPRKAPARPPQKAPTASSTPPVPGSPAPTLPARSDNGEGRPLALLPADQRRAPWMTYAIAEAKRLRGMTEEEIEASGTNYHTAIKDGISTMIGNHNAWCAAFVNWCLMKAGYPIENKSFVDAKAAKARAHAFHEVKGLKEQNGNVTSTIRNPLYASIETPIYGAIAMVTTPSGHGSHVGFVYAQEDEDNVILLGGNQSDQIKFSVFNRTPIKEKIYHKDGKQARQAAKPNRLLFFVPTAYLEQSKIDSKSLPTISSSQLNNEFKITTNPHSKSPDSTT